VTSLFFKSELIALPVDLSALLTLPKMTDAQFYEFCRNNPDLRIERNVSGEVMVMSPAFSDTGNRNGRLFGQLFIWAEANLTGEVFDSSTGFTLPNGAIRSPDAAWVLRERWEALSPEQQADFSPIAPDFVIELRSSSDTLTELPAKMQEYIDNGVRLGLLIDRKQQQVHVYRPDCTPQILHQPETVSCEPELVGFCLQMAKIW
jgi:Uma2 family endonuclease